MNAATISRVLSLIPDRTVRAQSGAQYLLEGSSCKYPDRLAHVTKFLNWLSPLDALSKDDQRTLGLLSANGRPVHAADEEEADLDADTDTEIDGELGAEAEATAEVEEAEEIAASWEIEASAAPLEQPAVAATPY